MIQGIHQLPSMFEQVWNEPGSSPTFWTGTEQDYYDLYNATATAIKRADPNLRVGADLHCAT